MSSESKISCMCHPAEKCQALPDLDISKSTHSCSLCAAKVCGICIGEEGFLNPSSKWRHLFELSLKFQLNLSSYSLINNLNTL